MVKQLWIVLGAVPLTAGLMLAQDTAGRGQTWSGLLVTAACQTAGGAGSGAMDRNTSSDMNRKSSDMDRTSSDVNKTGDMKRNTPPATTAGREQSSTYEQHANQADRNSTTSTPMARNTANTDQGSSMNQTRDMNRATPRTTGDSTADRMASSTASEKKMNRGANSAGDDMDRDRTTVAGLDNSCRISAQTTSFALRLDDGRVVPFDDASNSKIATQLQSGDRLTHKTKVFRANVKGSLQGDTISADTVEM